MDFPKSVPSIGLVDGKFVDENPLAGTPGSLIPSAWGNAITGEVLNVILASGQIPSEADTSQLLKAIRSLGQLNSENHGVDVGVANAYVFSLNPGLTQRQDGVPIRVKVKTTNTAASTINDGLGVVPLIGAAFSALQGGELVAGGMAWIEWNGSVGGGSYVLRFCTSASAQIVAGSQSRHAVNYSQILGVGQSPQNLTASRALSTTYTNTTGKPIYVSIISSVLAAGAALMISVNGVIFYGTSCSTIGSQFGAAASVIVPPGGTYSASVSTGGNGSLINWTELR
ncbi:hypothetical protein J3D48_004313 [Pseudomonas fluorescens]|uniref:hypothetical protein n=1 Tax=Pseudomonas fluorescens TaxID=294 RepID=UPI00209F191D|nr:hypothetical protein [Pseudomonas fluorescens]